MEKVQNVGRMFVFFFVMIEDFLVITVFVGDRISSQSWLEQFRLLIKERSLSSLLFTMLIGLCTVPVIIFILTMAFTFFGFMFVEGKPCFSLRFFHRTKPITVGVAHR